MISDENNNIPKLELRLISAISPSLAEILRDCYLKAAISRSQEIQKYVLGNPRAWLGTAYHEVLRKLWSPSFESLTDEDLIDSLWEKEVGILQSRASAHALNQRYSDPKKWSGLNLVHACVKMKALELLIQYPRRASSTKMSGEKKGINRERKLSAMKGKLIGTPDVIVGNEILDYKSGNIYDVKLDGTKSIKSAHIRQLHIYGYLVFESLGYFPEKGKLLPLQGKSAEINLDPDICTQEANKAIELLESFNSELSKSSDPSNLAAPSASACRWCQYKAYCSAFWINVNSDWSEELNSEAILGDLVETPVLIHQDRAYSLSIKISSGTTTSDHMTISPFDRSVYDFSEFNKGDTIRIINLYKRQDGQLVPTKSTICLQEERCPSFMIISTQTNI